MRAGLCRVRVARAHGFRAAVRPVPRAVACPPRRAARLRWCDGEQQRSQGWNVQNVRIRKVRACRCACVSAKRAAVVPRGSTRDSIVPEIYIIAVPCERSSRFARNCRNCDESINAKLGGPGSRHPAVVVRRGPTRLSIVGENSVGFTRSLGRP